MSSRTSTAFQSIETKQPTQDASVEVYREFYDRYAVARYGGYAILSGNVLHRNDPTYRSLHIAVLSARNNRRINSLVRSDAQGNPYHCFNYYPDDFAVATVDGSQIKPWKINAVYGIHDGRINAIDRPYNPDNETLHFDLADDTNVVVSRTGKQGTMTFADGNIGWILSAQESQAERERLFRG